MATQQNHERKQRLTPVDPLHESPSHFVQVVENSLNLLWRNSDKRWYKVIDFYRERYLNPDSPERNAFNTHGHGQGDKK